MALVLPKSISILPIPLEQGADGVWRTNAYVKDLDMGIKLDYTVQINSGQSVLPTSFVVDACFNWEAGTRRSDEEAANGVYTVALAVEPKTLSSSVLTVKTL